MSTKKILIIDDDAELCEEMAESLQAEGYQVQNTSDTAEGESLLSSQKFDCVFLDYKMPGLDGIEMLKKIKHKNPQTKVFIATGRPFIEKLLEEEKVLSLVAGIINKPFNSETLINKLQSTDKKYLNRKRSQDDR